MVSPMTSNPSHILRNLRNTRDFRAELLNIAASLADNSDAATIRVEEPAISEKTLRNEWDRLMVAVKPAIARRMRLELASSAKKRLAVVTRSKTDSVAANAIALERPNYRAEVLRLLVAANLAGDDTWSTAKLIKHIGASQTPVRQALQDLKRAGWAHRMMPSRIDVVAEDLSAESMAKLQAVPQILRFRFERGAHLRSPAELLERVLPLLRRNCGSVWDSIVLSGVAVAQAEVRRLDLAGIPRLDLIAFIPRDQKIFPADALRKLSDGLEHETSVLVSAPVVVTLVRADERDIRRTGVIDKVRCAAPADVFLSLLDMNLRAQANQYAKAIRP